jgi:uncharacterized protein (UPF0305 family)
LLLRQDDFFQVLKQVEVEEVDSADEESEEEYDEEDDDAIQEKVDQVKNTFSSKKLVFIYIKSFGVRFIKLFYRSI